MFYGEAQALYDIDLDIGANQVTSLIGPSGCGKSTFLRCLNRMNDVIDTCRVTGRITLDGEDIYDSRLDVVQLRARVGMVFQKPNPFPKSIYDNIAYGPRIHGMAEKREDLDAIVQSCNRAIVAGKGRALGGGQGPFGQTRYRPFGRTAAAPLHRARHRGQSRGDFDGRALFGPRSHRDGAH